MPHCRQLVFRPIGTARDARLVQTLHGMAAFTAAHFEGTGRSVSPDVYWWHRGVLTRVVRQDGDRPERTHSSEFDVLLMRLAAEGWGSGAPQLPQLPQQRSASSPTDCLW